MKKKIVLCILVMVMFITIGCSKKNDNDKTNNETNQNSILEVNIDGLTIKLDSKKEFYDMTFNYPLKAQAMTLGTYFMADYMNGSEFIFRLGTYYFENKTIEQAMSGSTVSDKGTTIINGREWHVYDDVTQDGKKMINYAYQPNNNTYTITFIYDKNIDNLISLFMNKVDFK